MGLLSMGLGGTGQGASASHMAATKSLDAIARMPGCDGEDSDALAAYTRIPLKDAERLLGPGVMPGTWMSLPRDRWPPEWHKLDYKDPVCPLLQNLYGHPLAGLLWVKGCQEKILKVGFEKVQGWECLYFHR